MPPYSPQSKKSVATYPALSGYPQKTPPPFIFYKRSHMFYNFVCHIKERLDNVNFLPLIARFNTAPLPIQQSGFIIILSTHSKKRKLAHNMVTYIE